jgi:Zn-dependent M28 family amino/carboxypeptidase
MTLKPILLIFIITGFFQTSCVMDRKHIRYSDTLRIANDLRIITKTKQSRNYKDTVTLNYVAQYIFDEFSKTCDTVYYQPYLVNGITYKNVIGSIGLKKKERIVIGAHYDVAGNQEGADDNASGVVGLLELARLMSKKILNIQVDFVAFSLEEPPFFDTEEMGSFIHAKSLNEKGVKLKGMICLEMIGYFNTDKKSQDYPIGFLRLFYGNRGDFITVVQKFGNGKFGRQINRKMKRIRVIKTKSFKGTESLAGIDLSDHLNYWKFNFKAIMITNTSFYRNKNYHQSTDKMETLDIKRMSLVIDEIYLTIKKLY